MIRQDLIKTVVASKSDASGASVERRKHILCVDDDDDTREMIACWLDLCGYEVTTTGSIGETLPLTERGGFDLLLLSGWYRDGRGVDLCRQIRAFDGRTPIVFLSAYSYATDIKEGLESGAQAYLPKPVDLDALTQTIEHFAVPNPHVARLSSTASISYPRDFRQVRVQWQSRAPK
jgi:DNA-binding response OmpR family regulator